MRIRIASVAVVSAMACLAVGVCRQASAAPADGVKAFCAANPNDDNPSRSYPAGKTGGVPPEVAKAGANTWRCMDGKVLVCNVGADGYPCQKLDPDPKPAKPVRDFCAAHPGSDFVPMYVIGDSATTWRCDSVTPKPLKTQPLDARNFVKGAWNALPH